MSKKTEYKMSDIIFAGFAQLSYLNWHKLTLLPKGTKLNVILENTNAFNQIKTSDYNDMYPPLTKEQENKLKQEIIQEVVKGNGYKITKPTKGKKEESSAVKDYLELSKAKHKIYHHKDPRLFYLYSENAKNAEKTPKYPEFGEWEFIAGFDTNKIHDLSVDEENNIFLKTYGFYNKDKDIECGFQASVFKKGGSVIITYRGSDSFSTSLLTDWIWTNISTLSRNQLPRAITYAVWVYEWVNSSFKNCQIHITGHSMGGALAQYVAVYSKFKHNTVTWNALGIGIKYKLPNIDNVRNLYKNTHYIDYFINYKAMETNPKTNKTANEKIRNFYIYEDMTANLQHRVGKVISVNKKDNDIAGKLLLEKLSDSVITVLIKLGYVSFVEKIKGILRGLMAGSIGNYHTVSNFLPFFDNSGMINLDTGTVSHNFVHNSIKMACQNNKKAVPKVINKNKVSLGKSLSNAINNKTSNKDNLFWYCLKKQVTQEMIDWYNPDVPEVGIFNNSKLVAGVPGGDPYPLGSNSNEKKASIVKTSNGNSKISQTK